MWGGASANIPHLEGDVAELFSDFEQWVQGTADRGDTSGLEVVLLVCRSLPRTTGRRLQLENRKNIGTAYEVSMSTVRSVSGLAVDVLNC